MIKQLYFSIILVITMFGILTHVNADLQNNNDINSQVDISGNIVKYTLPGNFSKDFPIENALKSVDLFDDKMLKKHKPAVLVRRWWDFDSGGFFSKNMGTMMMSMLVYRSSVPDKIISSKNSFIEIIQADFEQRDIEDNSGRLENDKIIYPSSYDGYTVHDTGSVKWLRNATGTMNEDYIVFHYWLPISPDSYLAVEFNFAPSSKISMRKFIDEYCREFFEKILSSYSIHYSSKSHLNGIELLDN